MYWSDQRKENEAMHHEIRRTLESKPSVLRTVVEKTGAADQVRAQFADYEKFVEDSELTQPTIEQLSQMAYELRIMPKGEIVPIEILEILKKQFNAALKVATIPQEKK
jgi:hypothetical protein